MSLSQNIKYHFCYSRNEILHGLKIITSVHYAVHLTTELHPLTPELMQRYVPSNELDR
jgi:hypothetical protein